MCFNNLETKFSIKPITKSTGFLISGYQRIQFDPEFLTACALAQKGEAFILNLYRQKKLLLAQPMIKRAIPGEGHLYDFISPFEYGIVYCSPETKKSDWQIFARAKRQYCRFNSIVSEFYRYSPCNNNIPDEAECVDRHVYLDLEVEQTDLFANWNNSLRRAIKRSFRQEIICRISSTDSDIDTFMTLYYNLMKRRQARNSYFFSLEYFKTLLQYCSNSWLLILESKSGLPIAGSIVVGCGDLYYHLLTASDPKYLASRPNERLIFELFCFCKRKKGGKKLMLGGGDTGVKNFKLRFSKLTLPYFVTRQVYSKKLYKAACNKKKVSVLSNFFPAYRI